MENSYDNYLEINKALWNERTTYHVNSEFYNLKDFLNGQSSLNSIELDLLGNINGKRVLHLQCHFGQDTLSLARMGAQVTGVDFSETAIEAARSFAKKTGLAARFICCDVFSLPQYLNETFDIVFSSYGTIGWLPDMTKWAGIVSRFLKPAGVFVFAEFHPVVWMMDNDFTKIQYSYFNHETITETESGTYADRQAAIKTQSITWNHGLGEVIGALTEKGLTLQQFNEFDYSPYNCLQHLTEAEPGKFRIAHLGKKIPMVYSLKAVKS